jgi:hypothetical protein
MVRQLPKTGRKILSEGQSRRHIWGLWSVAVVLLLLGTRAWIAAAADALEAGKEPPVIGASNFVLRDRQGRCRAYFRFVSQPGTYVGPKLALLDQDGVERILLWANQPQKSGGLALKDEGNRIRLNTYTDGKRAVIGAWDGQQRLRAVCSVVPVAGSDILPGRRLFDANISIYNNQSKYPHSVMRVRSDGQPGMAFFDEQEQIVFKAP